MRVRIKKWFLSSKDHLWLADTSILDYRDRDFCCSICSTALSPIIEVRNVHGNKGLELSMCKRCAFVTQTHSLKPDYLREHFRQNWHNSYRRPSDNLDIDEPFAKLKNLVKEGSTVLDVGCGDGSRLVKFAEHGCLVYGTEPSEKQAYAASKKISRIENKTGEDYLQNCQELFDLIFMHNVLQFVENPLLLLDLATSRLSKNGVLYLKAGGVMQSNIFYIAHQTLMMNYFSVKTLRTYAHDNNLYIVELSDVEFVLSRSNLALEALELGNFVSSSPICEKAITPSFLANLPHIRNFFGFYHLGSQKRFVWANSADVKEKGQVTFEYQSIELPVLLK